MKNNKLVKLLIPLVAVVIIFESIMLVSNLNKENKAKVKETDKLTNIPTKELKKVEPPVADLILIANNDTEMKVGKSYKVELKLLAKKELFIDAIESYIKYNPELVTISGLTSNSKLPKANLSQIDSIKGVIKDQILIDDTKGYKLVPDETNQVLTFNLVPKKEGLIQFEFMNVDKGLDTMLVETKTSKDLPLSTAKLEVKAIK